MDKRLTKSDYNYMSEDELLDKEAYYNRLKELEDIIYDSYEFPKMSEDILKERKNENEILRKNIHDLHVSTADALNAVIVAANRYRTNCDETYFNIEKNRKYGIDFGVRWKKCTLNEFKEIVGTTVAALDSVAYNIDDEKEDRDYVTEYLEQVLEKRKQNNTKKIFRSNI